jgi:hypothetical protein
MKFAYEDAAAQFDPTKLELFATSTAMGVHQVRDYNTTNGDEIATIDVNDFQTSDEGDGVMSMADYAKAAAIARLFVAAPKLLKALEQSAQRIDHLCRMVNSISRDPKKTRPEDWSDTAREAIALVRGV